MRPLLVVMALAGGAGIATADKAAPVEDRSVEWTVPDECPPYPELLARIEARLGDALPASAPRMRVSIRRTGKRLVATMWKLTEDGQGTEARSLTSSTCGPLTDAIALVIARHAAEANALATAVGDAPEGDLTYEAEEPPDVAVVTAFPASRRADPSPLERPTVAPTPRSVADVALTPQGIGARLLAVSGVGTVPGVGLGGELAVFGRRKNFFGEVALTRWSRRPSAGGLATESTAVGLDVLAVRMGYVPAHTLLRTWAVTEVGRWSSDFVMPTRAHVAVGAGAAVAWPISDQVRVVGVFETTLTVIRNPFQAVSGGPEVHRPAGGAARCSLGVELGWW